MTNTNGDNGGRRRLMHSRSIEFAKKFNVPIHVRSSFSDVRGTMIVADPEIMESPGRDAA